MEPVPRFYLTGRVTVEGPRGVVDQAGLAGRQGRRLIVRLAVERDHPVPLERLAATVWPGEPPRSWEPSLRALVSKLRAGLERAGIDPATIRGEAGCYQLWVPDAWVDVHAAANHIDRAEGSRRRGDLETAWSEATVTAAITARPLLPGEEGGWLDAQRDRLVAVRLRALDCLASVWSDRGEHRLAIAMAERAVELAPFRESVYRRLMRIQSAAGDRAEALRTFDRCRRLLADELGVSPSPDTEAVYLEALGT